MADINPPETSLAAIPPPPSYDRGTLTGPIQLQPSGSGPAPGTPEYNAAVGKMPGINAAALMSQITSSVTDLQKSTTAGWAAAGSAGQGASLIEQGKNTINASDMMELLARKANDAKVYEMFGTNPYNPTKIAILAQETAAMEDDIRGQQSMIRDKMKVGFLDNPLQWIVNQITLPFDIEAVNNSIANRNDEYEVIHKLALSTSEGVQADAAAAYNTSTAKLQGLAMENAGVALQQSADATFKAVSAGISGANVSGNLADTEYKGILEGNRYYQGIRQFGTQTEFEKARLELSTLQFSTSSDLEKQRFGFTKEQFATNLALEKQRFELDQKRFNLSESATQFTENLQASAAMRAAESHAVQMELGNLQAGDAQAKNYARADLNNRLGQAGVMMGIKAPTIEELQLMSDGKVKAAWMDLMQQPDIQRGVYGLTPTSAMDLASTLKAQLAPGNAVLFNQLSKIAAAKIASMGVLAKQYTPEQLTYEKDTAIKLAASSSLASIADTGDIYSPAPLRKILAIPAVAASPLAPGLSVLANSKTDADGTYPTRSVDIIGAANALLLEPNSQYTPSDMAGIVNGIFKSIASNTDSLKQFNRLALPTIAAEGKYNITVDKQNGSYGHETINGLNRAQLETYFTRFLINQQMNALPTAPSP